ncbi:MAG: toxin HicA [Proteobacteria bacterium]|jgi:hypothetical protein|nr:toxin HicA [Pseudomonadota bacterium]
MTSRVEKLIAAMAGNPQGVRYEDLCKVCAFHFGEARQRGSSHRIYRTGVASAPLVNIQRGAAGMAKPYQVRQVLKAIAEKEG